MRTIVAISLFLIVSTAAAAETETLGPLVLRVVYFVPSDRQPLARHQERLGRVMEEVQRFYREGMDAAGYGPQTFGLERDAEGRLKLHTIQGRLPMREYGRNDAGKVRDEVKAALAAEGIDADRETLVIFQVLLEWRDGKAEEVGPYVGGRHGAGGTAWVYDDEKLDPRLLPSKQPGGYYGGPCSIGEFNSHYIGGVAHELGHALGLPHVCQRQADRSRGLALMGGGNHTYGRELRGEGPGTFLADASAMLLASSRLFAGNRAERPGTATSRLRDVKAEFADGRLVLQGRLDAQPSAEGIAAYDDWAKIAADYDAVGWTCRVASDGRFRLEVGELRPGASQLRLVVCHRGGARSEHAFDYTVDPRGRPDTQTFVYRPLLAEAVAAYAAGDRRQAEALAARVQRQFRDVETARRQAAHLARLLSPQPPRVAAEIPAAAGTAAVSSLDFRRAQVGWGQPLRDQVRIEGAADCFLRVGGKFFESGLYAHAPARHEIALARRWKRFRTGFALQDGHPGSVVFVVRGDGKELFRSPLVNDQQLRSLDLDVASVDVLELAVEDGGNGANADWGVWIEPQLER